MGERLLRHHRRLGLVLIWLTGELRSSQGISFRLGPLSLGQADLRQDSHQRYLDGHRWYYAFDMAPGYWKWLTCQFSSGELGSVSRVRDELVASRDNGEAEADWLARWVSQQPHSCWFKPQGPTTHELKNWHRVAFIALH